MWNEEPRETELAFKVADRIISIQECEEGYDYSIMDENYREIDGGVYDNPDVDIRYALLDIVDDLATHPDTNGAREIYLRMQSGCSLIMMKYRSKWILLTCPDRKYL